MANSVWVLKESHALNASVFTEVASHFLSVVWLFTFILHSTLHSLQVKKN